MGFWVSYGMPLVNTVLICTNPTLEHQACEPAAVLSSGADKSKSHKSGVGKADGAVVADSVTRCNDDHCLAFRALHSPSPL